MKIALDAMGGDFAPTAVIKGAVEALSCTPKNVELILLGNKDLIQKEFSSLPPSRISIHHCPDSITFQDRASTVVKSKPDSSIVQGIKMVKENKVNGFISAGHTGAVLAASLLILGRIPGVRRPALGVYIPTNVGGKILCDVGANPDAKPFHLFQFATMGSHYLDHIEGCKHPKIGLINIGEESNKGSDLYREAYKIFKDNLPNFVGNIEGRNLLNSEANVLICDGFVGNTLLKFAESWIDIFGSEIRTKIKEKLSYKFGAFLLKPVFEDIRKNYDYEEHGGVPLLGVNGVSIIAHGSAGCKSIKNSILAAKKCIDENLIEDTKNSISNYLELN